MYRLFKDRTREVTIEGKPSERWVVNRLDSLNSAYKANYMYKGLIPSNSNAECGDVVTCGSDRFFIISKARSVTGTLQVQMQKVNCTVNVVRVRKEFINGTATGKYIRDVLKENVPAVFRDVTTKMRQYDVGLLQTTNRKFIIPKMPNLKLIDTIEFQDMYCQVDMINESETEGLYTLQTQKDKRVLARSMISDDGGIIIGDGTEATEDTLFSLRIDGKSYALSEDMFNVIPTEGGS